MTDLPSHRTAARAPLPGTQFTLVDGQLVPVAPPAATPIADAIPAPVFLAGPATPPDDGIGDAHPFGGEG